MLALLCLREPFFPDCPLPEYTDSCKHHTPQQLCLLAGVHSVKTSDTYAGGGCLTSPTARWTQLTPKNLLNLTDTETNDHPKLLVWKFCSCREAAFTCGGKSLHIFILLVWNHVFLLRQRVAEEMPWPPSQIHSWTATKSWIGLKVFKEQNFLIWRWASWDSQTLRPAETASICACLQRAPVRWEEFLSFEQRIPSLNRLRLYYLRCSPLLFRFPSWLCSIRNLHCTNRFQTECHVWFG